MAEAPGRGDKTNTLAHDLAGLQLLADASARLLAPPAHVNESLVAVARIAIPYFGEWCFVNAADAAGNMRQLDIVHSAPSELSARLKPYCLFGRGLDETKPFIVEVEAGWLENAAENSTHAELLRSFEGSTGLILPFFPREEILGALIFFSSARYGAGKLALAEELADRCAMALHNARRYAAVIGERDNAKKASRAKDEFLAILSHELRNPLVPLIGWTRMLREHPLIVREPLLAEGVRSMERNARTIERLVGDCLDLSRISEGGIRLERKPVDLNLVVAASIESVKEMVAAKGLSLDPQIMTDSALLLGDATRLEQVMVNLLVNAVKYTGPGGSISVRCARMDNEAEIEVSDTGTGIHPAFLDHIFEPFRRGSSSWLTNQSGLGLGLAIARQIVHMHGGRIWAESAGLDAGSTFRVRLPLAAAASTESPRELARIGESEPGAGLRILIIEDSEDICFLLKIELELVGHTVFTASDGESGLVLAKARMPDLIISDIKMPGMDGLDFIRELRSTDAIAAIPAIALTGLGGKSGFDRAIVAGFDACVSKPAEPREISTLIRTLTEKNKSCR